MSARLTSSYMLTCRRRGALVGVGAGGRGRFTSGERMRRGPAGGEASLPGKVDERRRRGRCSASGGEGVFAAPMFPRDRTPLIRWGEGGLGWKGGEWESFADVGNDSEVR